MSFIECPAQLDSCHHQSGSHGVTDLPGILKQHVEALLSEGGCSILSLLHQMELGEMLCLRRSGNNLTLPLLPL